MCLLLLEENSLSGPVPGVTGLGYSGGGGGAQWDRGANLKEYYARRDEQEAQAVRTDANKTSDTVVFVCATH